MIDFHTHLLPGIDDGSRDVEHSIKMLSLYPKEVSGIVLTPHFYPSQDNPEGFLNKRRDSYEKLLEGVKDIDHPKFYLGCEFYYYNNMHTFERLRDFAIEGTNLLLVEPPMKSWSINMMDDILAIRNERNLIPVLAHIDRYDFAKGGNEKAFEYYVKNGGLVQMNFEAFKGFFNKRTALKFLREDVVQFLGTDCHNTSDRKPDMDEFFQKIKDNVKFEVLGLVQRNEELYFENSGNVF